MSIEKSTSDTPTQDTEDSKPKEAHQVHNVCNKSTHEEDDSFEDKHVTEIEPYTKNGEKYIGIEDKLLTTNSELKIENQKAEGLITYSMEKQIFKFKVNSGTNKE